MVEEVQKASSQDTERKRMEKGVEAEEQIHHQVAKEIPPNPLPASKVQSLDRQAIQAISKQAKEKKAEEAKDEAKT